MPMRPPGYVGHTVDEYVSTEEWAYPRGRPTPMPPTMSTTAAQRTFKGEKLMIDLMVGKSNGQMKREWERAQRYAALGMRTDIQWARQPLPVIDV